MDGIRRYKIFYTQTASDDIEMKADYIAFQLQDPSLSETWYLRLRDLIQENLSVFPLKYPLYDAEPWRGQGVRLFTARNDVILYSVDNDTATVYIRGVCTRGRDLSAHLAAQNQ